MNSLLNPRSNSEMERMFGAFDRLFNSLWSPSQNTETANTVALDVWESDGHIFVRASIPGTKPEDVEVSINEGVLTISGETRAEFESNENARVYRREFRYGKFARSIRLPEEIDVDGIQAEFENGFVTIDIPRVEVPRPEPKRIAVKTKGADQPAIESGKSKK